MGWLYRELIKGPVFVLPLKKLCTQPSFGINTFIEYMKEVRY